MELLFPFDVATQTKARYIMNYEGIDLVVDFAAKYGTNPKVVDKRLKESTEKLRSWRRLELYWDLPIRGR